MRSADVLSVLRADTWSIAELKSDSGPGLVRFRTPVLEPGQLDGYDRVLRILWPYAEEESGAMPDVADSQAMDTFEGRLCAALEIDAHAYLAAVLTFDGARQWVFYTSDIAECGRRLEAMPQEADPYPIELDAFDDPNWLYLREQILGSVLA